MAAFAVSFVVNVVAAKSDIRLSVPTATLGGVVALLPGLTVTVAMTELARRHLAAGTARLSGAFLVFVAIAFGVAVGGEVAQAIVGDGRSFAPRALPPWTLTLALGIVPLVFGVLLRARPRDFPWLLLSGAIGYTMVRVAALWFGPAIAASVGAMVIGVLANLYDRRGYGPASVALVPGVLCFFEARGSAGQVFAMSRRRILRVQRLEEAPSPVERLGGTALERVLVPLQVGAIAEEAEDEENAEADQHAQRLFRDAVPRRTPDETRHSESPARLPLKNAKI